RTETPKRYRYTGKERDEETGLSYHGARYYAPWLGRWTAADPEGLVDGADLYVYARNNPVRYVDPNGMESFLCGKCVLPPLALQAALLRSEERSKDQYQVRNRFGGRRVVKSKMGPGTEGEKLLHIMEMAAREFPLRVRLFSAYRDSEGAHGEGLAVDIQIFDENGLAIASYQVPQTANIYALFALKARKIQMELYPELNDFFVWGGGWSGMKEGGGEGTYGAADWMHFEIRSPKRLREKGGMSVFSWEEGWLEGAGHYREGCFLGITGQVDLERDLKRLVGLTLSSDQRETQRKIGGEFPAGLSHRPIGPRLPVIPDLRLEFDPRPHFRPPESQPTTPIFWWEIPHPWHNILQ
ncbi:RHS repeat-associated core domain-containing protein, partial [Desulfonatronospira sp.]|uniref:RHS repeat-associated core domain-containing protein n=1 Tax=Desulfonatronospira sp. TaxID=1962951 RepID=UPI0025C0BAE5